MDRGAKSCLAFARVTDIQRKHLISGQSFLRVHMSFLGGKPGVQQETLEEQDLHQITIVLIGLLAYSL